MAREIWTILKDEAWTTENLAELRTALGQVENFANETLYRHLTSRTSVETLDALHLLREAIRQFDTASGALVNTTNVLTEKVRKLTVLGVVFAGIAAILALGALWLTWLSYQLALGQVGK